MSKCWGLGLDLNKTFVRMFLHFFFKESLAFGAASHVWLSFKWRYQEVLGGWLKLVVLAKDLKLIIQRIHPYGS